jgi:SAM-dependent methyltransferase
MDDTAPSAAPETRGEGTGKTKEVPCNLCGSRDATVLGRLGDRVHGIPGSWPYVRCRSCGLVYLTPRPDAKSLGRYYPSDYACYRTAETPVAHLKRWALKGVLGREARGAFTSLGRLAAEILAPLAGEFPLRRRGGNLLDVGCGTGWYLRLFEGQAGWKAFGLEAEGGTARAAQEAGLRVRQGTLAEAAYPENFFDVVHLWHVLEHLDDPREALGRIRGWMKPGGELILGVPNPDSASARIFGTYWHPLDAPRHLTLFTRRTLEGLLREEGYRVLRTRTFGVRSVLASLQIAWNAAAGRIRGTSRTGGRLFSCALPAKALTPLDLALGLLNLGDTLSLWAAKESDA